MEDCRRKKISGDPESDFEFGCLTPRSPNSPADHLFLNGRLLPHAFPTQPSNNPSFYSRSTSRTSSAGSRDSSMWSRSNSSNSSRSGSARTSTSDRAVIQGRIATKSTAAAGEKSRGSRPALVQQYGSSRRWQLIAAAPVLKHQGSLGSKRSETGEGEKQGKRKGEERESSKREGFGRRFFRSFVSTCKECHAIKPTRIEIIHPSDLNFQ